MSIIGEWMNKLWYSHCVDGVISKDQTIDSGNKAEECQKHYAK